MRALIGAVMALSLMLPGVAHAQPGGFGPGTGGGFGPPTPSRPGKPQPSRPSDVPETHAASGAGDRLVTPGGEPTLPDDPLAISETVASQIGTDAAANEPSVDGESVAKSSFYGLYYERMFGSEHSFRTSIPPFWFERVQPSVSDPATPDRASLFGLYYNRRSAERADDILFPLIWNLRDTEGRSTVVGPWFHRNSTEAKDHWLAPLYFYGSRPGDSAYAIIPPLLTYMNHDEQGGLNFFGPIFCSWKGGSRCDSRTASELDLGVAPLYFAGHDAAEEYRLIPPLLHYRSYDRRQRSTLNIWGPVYSKQTEELNYFHIFPVYFSVWGEDQRHTTVFPFFHYGTEGSASLLITPLFLSSTSQEGYETLLTWGYARYRGKTELDMFTPLYWQYRDPEVGFTQTLIPPVFMRRKGPREDTTVVFPLYANIERHGLSHTRWVTPFFSHSTDLRGWSTNIYPILFLGRDGFDTHTVIAPFFWDFATRSSRSTVGFPIYWRFADERKVTQLIGNVYYSETKVRHGSDWQVNVFPLFSYGETPDGHWWNVLFGLAGFTRKGTATELRTLWIPIQLSE